MKRFYLGTHHPNWLSEFESPLFVSHRTLSKYRRGLPVARSHWALDSGGFSELSMYGGWRTSPAEYIRWVRRYRDEIGQLDWCAPQDWMCEDFIVAKTGLSVEAHQARTVLNYRDLCREAPDLPFIPVLQGQKIDDYFRCWGMYATIGIDLRRAPLVGLGSVCRRQGTSEIAELVEALTEAGLRLHGFGVKISGLRIYGEKLTSADSLAWSYRGRRVPGCEPSHKNEANCRTFARQWRDSLPWSSWTVSAAPALDMSLARH